MKKLTCVIPFLNEGIEVLRTVKSIRDTVGDRVDILLINDGSQDGVNYSLVAKTFSCDVLTNRSRAGVANSRDYGVQLAKTDYCLILDAHMRFYSDDWDSEVIKAIDENPRTIVCTGCKVLWHPWDEKDGEEDRINYGAYLDYNFQEPRKDYLEPKWAPKTDQTRDIPIVLGANYGFKKEYYKELGGLHGLQMYGGDEAWLSLKSWAVGNGCKLIPHVVIGHLFRLEHPYAAPTAHSVYNKIVICSVLFPDKTEWINKLLKHGGKGSWDMLRDSLEEIKDIRRNFVSKEQIGWRAKFKEINDKYYKGGEL